MTFMRHMVVCLLLLIPLCAQAEQVPPTETRRTVTLEEVIYTSPADWSITLNGEKITPTSNRPEELIELEVLSGEESPISERVRLKWLDKKLDGVVDVRLETFQKYDLETHETHAIMPPPPQGMTEDEWEWVQTVVTKPINFNPQNYQENLMTSSKYFTKEGWDSFTSLMLKMHMSDTVQSLKQTVWSYLRAGPITILQDISNKSTSWTFQVPLSTNYQGGGHSRQDNFIFYITIIRNASGLAIGLWETPPSLSKGQTAPN